MKHSSNQQGLTLVELIVSLALSMLATLGVITLFTSQSDAYRSNNSISDLQETGRIALDIISQDVRMAGYQGCTRHLPYPGEESDASNIYEVTAANTVKIDFRATAVRGYDTSDSGWLAGADTDIQNIASYVASGTDIIALTYADFQASAPTGNIGKNDGTLTLANGNVSRQILLGEKFIITDCEKANIVTRTNSPTADSDGGALTFDGVLSANFDTDANILKFNTNIYFIGDTFNPARTLPDNTPITALFSSNGETNADGALIATELLAGVESMQFMYGTNNNGAMQFNSANNIPPGSFDQIVSVKIGLLAASTTFTGISNDDKSYTLAGVTIASTGLIAHGNDSRMRRRFNTAVSIRNRRAEF